MIEFVTLFLGLVSGARWVEVAVDDRVAAVVLHLDGRQVARLEEPPWKKVVDLGDLEPHRLEAVAIDAAGRQLERVHRLINYSRSDYQAVILLGSAPRGAERSGRVVWEAVLDRDPVRLEARFDERPLAVGADGRFLLPPHDPSKGHSVEAELTFEDGHVVRAEMTLGGVYGERLTSALTAVPVTSPPGRPWSAEQVAGWLERDGRPLGVFTAKAERGTLLLLRDLRTAAELRWLRKRLGLQQSRLREAGPLSYSVVTISSRPVEARPDTFRFVPLTPSTLSHGLLPLLMADGSITGQERERKKAPQRLWDSLAAAGAHAALTNRPRAVLLTVGTDPGDESYLTWEQAAHYLESLRVPLYVWSPLAEVLAELGLTGAPRAFSGPVGLETVVDRIAAELESQTIVWVEGEHLPGEVSMSDAAPEGVELVR